jgi:hypothetical protein
MKANDQVPTPQGKVTMAFTAQGSRRGRTLLPGGPKMAKIAPQPWESGECLLTML